ncbi:MAG: hypothetical protein AAGI11_11820 [Pseudomonadota bacterium]
MQEAYIKKHVAQATRYAYWSGAAAGMVLGAVLGIFVGLVW